MKSFLMMGQSNMAGRGNFGEVEPISNKRTFMLRNGKWQPMSEPINVDRPIKFSGKLGTNSGIGPAASFADSYANYYNEDIGLIPCAEGGSSLDEWKIDGQLFLHAFYQAKLAMNNSELIGIIWHQGEAEMGSFERASTYKERFLAIMNEFQSRLGVKLDIVVGELGYFLYDRADKHLFVRDVNSALNDLALLPGIAIASAEGLTDRGDQLHFDSVSQREFGKRYFEAYRKLKENNI
jgi:hypothetical protein